jgi:exopolysaccharide biosynthesis polyprenyl glycosylphosphotransferase
MTMLADEMAGPRVIPRGLQATEHRLLLASGDAAAAAAAVVVSLWLWSIPAGWEFSAQTIAEHAWWFCAVPLWLVTASLPAAPSSIAFSLRRTLAALLRASAVLLVAYAGWYFYAPRGVLPRLVTVYFVWEATLLTLAWRLVFVTIFTRERFRQRAIIVGSGRAAALALDTMRRYRGRQTDVIGFVPGSTEDGALTGIPRIDPSALLKVATARSVSEIVLALEEDPDETLLKTLLVCQEAGAQVVRVQTLTEQILHRVPIDLLKPDWLMTDLADAMRLREASWWAKRALDLAGAVVGLTVLSVVTPIIAAAIWLDTGSPIFYRQRRVGRGGLPFTLVKFRTMTRHAERPGEARWAGRNDPRVTRAGRVLRKTRLDELPQMWDVLRGEMSLVGPRPERSEFIDHLQQAIPFYRARLMVPPGLTGWAQVNLPYGDSVGAAKLKLEFDLYYVKHRTLWFDVVILLRTVATVLGSRGH